jgi:hypothetical protein
LYEDSPRGEFPWLFDADCTSLGTSPTPNALPCIPPTEAHSRSSVPRSNLRRVADNLPPLEGYLEWDVHCSFPGCAEDDVGSVCGEPVAELAWGAVPAVPTYAGRRTLGVLRAGWGAFVGFACGYGGICGCDSCAKGEEESVNGNGNGIWFSDLVQYKPKIRSIGAAAERQIREQGVGTWEHNRNRMGKPSYPPPKWQIGAPARS